jgi:type II secretion system protein L
VFADETSRGSLEPRLAALDRLLADHPEWTGGRATVALAWPGEQATVHRLTLPFVDRAQVERTLPFTVEAEVPFDLEEMVLAWRIVSQTTDTQVLCVLVKRVDLQRVVQALQQRGLDPKHVFVDADLLSSWAPRGRTVAMVDVGHTHTTVSVAVDGAMHFARAIPVGGADFTAAISRALQIPWREAEALKHGAGIHSSEAWAALPPAARSALDAPIGLLLAEVRSTLIAAEDATGIDVDELRLTGGGSRLHPIPRYLQEDLGIAVEDLADGDQAIPLEFTESDALARVLAHTGGVSMLDLRVGALAWRGGTDVLRAVVLYGGALMAFVAIVVVVGSIVQYRALVNEQRDIEERMVKTVIDTFPDVDAATVADGTLARAIVTEKTKAAIDRAAVLDREGDAPPTIEMLHALTQAFPPPEEVTVDVSELSIARDNVNFSAETDGYASAAAVEDSLKKSPQFAQAAKGNEKKSARDNRVTFTVTIPIGDAGNLKKEDGGG